MRNVHLYLRQQDPATVTESGGARQRVFRAGERGRLAGRHAPWLLGAAPEARSAELRTALPPSRRVPRSTPTRTAAAPPPPWRWALLAAPSEGALDALPPRPPSPPHSDHLRVAQEAVHLIPFDPALASPGFRELRRLKPRTEQAYAELAAELLR
ncbi:hypothetical protein [Streptomyces sp. SCSIO ZS0520]|uniref:hypothetical protein n=1 Tax=Streptomyces sp. SCSIO ZS0520 TaxID=2892996 RepID=UPI0021DB15FB|nr:hypothetical protein [Streptomyces sp. SCSIO ZS0520]